MSDENFGVSKPNHWPDGRRVRDEIEEIHDKMGYTKIIASPPVDPQTPAEKEFWDRVAQQHFGTIWNQPEVSNRCAVKGKQGMITNIIRRGDAVDAVDVTFDDGTSGRYEPYRLEKLS